MIKIAYFIDRLIHGGTELQLIEQINRLAEYGIMQELFCLYKSVEHDKIHLGCKVHFLNIPKLLSLNCIRKLFYLKGYLKSNSFNIVQTYFFDSTVVGVLAGKLAGGLTILSCRRDLGFWYTPKLLFCLKFINWMTDRIVVNSNAVKESVQLNEVVYPEKIDIIPNGINVREFEYPLDERQENRMALGIPPGKLCVGTITNMSRKVKRVDLFINAAAYILKQSNEFHFIILGDGKYRNELIELSENLGIKDNLSFFGRDVSKHKVLSIIDIGVLTSDSEGFSNAVMEYMAAGLPVVATAVGGNLDLVENGKTGLLTASGDYGAMGEKILLLNNNSVKRIEMGNKGKTEINKYDWEIMNGQIISYYKNIIRQS